MTEPDIIDFDVLNERLKDQQQDSGATWPEQDAIDDWWREHSFELKQVVTAYRVRVQAGADQLRRQLHEEGVFDLIDVGTDDPVVLAGRIARVMRRERSLADALRGLPEPPSFAGKGLIAEIEALIIIETGDGPFAAFVADWLLRCPDALREAQALAELESHKEEK